MKTAARVQLTRQLAVAAAIAIADQGSKWWVINSSLPEQPHILAPFLRLVYAENPGAAFSFLATQGEWARWLLCAFSAAACLLLVAWLWRAPPRLEGAALSLILGGAFGNLIDRWRLGYVVDFIDVHAGVYHWPAFNVADSAITLGALLLIKLIIFNGKKT